MWEERRKGQRSESYFTSAEIIVEYRHPVFRVTPTNFYVTVVTQSDQSKIHIDKAPEKILTNTHRVFELIQCN